MKIIPAIDIIEGKCVRLKQGDYSQKTVYNENPLEVAKMFEDHGFTDLHLVDLDGAKASHVVNFKVLETLASSTQLKIDFGGGIKSDEDIRDVFNAGANQATVGSLAVKQPEVFKRWLNTFGGEKIILSADAMNEKIAIQGWQEDSGIDLIEFLKENMGYGILYATVTDISKDGMLQGISIDLYQKIQQTLPNLNLIASGGVKDLHDIEQAAEHKMYGIIIGKAIYENQLDLNELVQFQD